ncbi:uncharacterized protein LOC129749388 [Uranotaenia lowii]|uniref:uncharacterized protein LOC129749388 n=1 Tax=Uranotaenia lowii TaxID=190385 RepID=UPI002479C2C4|nr:uncharacterized protein LOC129749388 [Uranotaenia lowii]
MLFENGGFVWLLLAALCSMNSGSFALPKEVEDQPPPDFIYYKRSPEVLTPPGAEVKRSLFGGASDDLPSGFSPMPQPRFKAPLYKPRRRYHQHQHASAPAAAKPSLTLTKLLVQKSVLKV